MEMFYIVDIGGFTEALHDLLDIMPWLPKRIGILYSYFNIRKDIGKLCKVWEKHRNHGFKIMLDSGAFRIIRGGLREDMNEYLKSYSRFINEYGQYFDIIVTLDVPPSPINEEVHIVRLDFAYLTIRNTLFLIRNTVYEQKIMPVVQGWTIDEYVMCARLLKEHGICRNIVGVGNLVPRRNNRRGIETIYKILTRVKELLNVNIHAFGMNYRALMCNRIRLTIYSADSSYMVYSLAELGKVNIPGIGELNITLLKNVLNILKTYGYEGSDEYRQIENIVKKCTFRNRGFIILTYLSQIIKLVKSDIIHV